jgi:hypothetical protein
LRGKEPARRALPRWEEHRAEHADGHGYSRFCALYGEWRKRLAPTMRQMHVAGDKLFVDWAGDTVPIIDAMTGEVHEAHLFVAALGASSYTYAEAPVREALGCLRARGAASLSSQLLAQGIVTRMGRGKDSGRSLEPGPQCGCALDAALNEK